MTTNATARLSDDFLASDHQGYVHSVFSRVINVLYKQDGKTEGGLITLAAEGVHGAPDSLTIDETAFKAVIKSISPHDSCRHAGMLFNIGNANIKVKKNLAVFAPRSETDARQALDAFNRSQGALGEGSWFLRALPSLSQSCADGISNLIAGIMKGDAALAVSALGLVGLGAGLTPSYDDALVGAFAALYSWSDMDRSILRKRSRAAGWEDFLSATTDVSRKFLTCAMDGRFSDSLLALIEAVSKGSAELERSARAVRETGHTSGSDTLWGLTQALQCIVRTRAGGILCRETMEKRV